MFARLFLFRPMRVIDLFLMFALMLIVLLFLHPMARAGDIASPVTKAAPLTFNYPTRKCGMYYGVNTSLSTGTVASTTVGTQVAQGAVGLTVGYTCPMGAGYWFGDADGAFANLNGSSNGFNPTGPAQFSERFGFGAPVDLVLGLIPGLKQVQTQIPALLPLPADVNVVTSNPYIAGAFHQDDTGIGIGLQSNKQYLLSGGFQLGTKTLLSNGVMADLYAEYTLPSTEVCVGVTAGCVKRGAMFRVGTKLLWGL